MSHKTQTAVETLDGRHPEDAIFGTATFIRQLSEVQTTYFDKLVTNLELSEEGASHLFDYIYNAENEQYEDFADYLEQLGLTYCSQLKKQPAVDED